MEKGSGGKGAETWTGVLRWVRGACCLEREDGIEDGLLVIGQPVIHSMRLQAG